MSDARTLPEERFQLLLDVADLQHVRESVKARRDAAIGEPHIVSECEWLIRRIERSLGVLAERCTQLGLTREFALLSTGWPYNLRPAERPGSSAQRVHGALATLGNLTPSSSSGNPAA